MEFRYLQYRVVKVVEVGLHGRCPHLFEYKSPNLKVYLS